jgi:SAM-dependent methyltransferase
MTNDDRPGQAAGHPHGRHAHGHDHGHSHDFRFEDRDWAAMADDLERGAAVEFPSLRTAAGWLRDLLSGGGSGTDTPHPVHRALDVGSGPAVAGRLLAEVFPEAEVVAVDGSPELLGRARERAAEQGIDTARFTTLTAELPAGFDTLGRADLIWTSRALHHLGDQQHALDRLAGTLNDGGLLAVAEGGLPPRFLPRNFQPGRPGFQARLDALVEDWFVRMRAELPEEKETVEDWPAMLERAGLTPSGSRTFLTEHQAPLNEPARDYLHTYLTRIADRYADGLNEEDLRTLKALLDDDAPTGIRRRPDAFYLSATTVHTARARRTS